MVLKALENSYEDDYKSMETFGWSGTHMESRLWNTLVIAYLFFFKSGVCHNIDENIKSCSLSSGIVDIFKFHFLSMKVKVKSLSRVQLFATPWTIAYQAPPAMGFFRQEYWSGLPFPSPGDLPDPRIKPRSPALQADSLPLYWLSYKGSLV